MFSIDPYNIDGAMAYGPAIYWGFNVTTCFVEKTDAARLPTITLTVPGLSTG